MRKTVTLDGHRDDAAIDLTPMLDVVFIMLIFFIVTASFIRESGLDVLAGEGSVAQTPQDRSILVRIGVADDYWINDRLVQSRALRANLAALHAVDSGLPVVILPDPSSSAQALVMVLDAANANGIDNVTVSEALPTDELLPP